MNKIDKNTYSVKTSYALGDKYRINENYLAAELCYALPLIGDHIINRRESGDINPRKLHDLMLYREQIRYVPPSKGKDIAELLPFIRSFYKSWQQEIIKPDMITRSEIHAQFRKQAVIKVFKEATKKYNLADKLDFIALDNIALDTHNQQLEKIDNWMGPSFSKLQYKKSGKTSKSKRGSNKISQLTVVMDCKKYRKRCLNSQEDWFKKFDGVFFARCLKSILEIINDNIINENDRKFIKLKFAKRILARKIQFKSASAKLLIPAGTLFACKELMNALHEYHTKLDAANIKQASKCTVKIMHQKLMKVINIEYNKVCNECNIFDDDISEYGNAALTFEVDDDPKTISASTTTSSSSSCSVELKAEQMNDNGWLLKNENMFIGNNNNMNNQSMMPIVTNFVPFDNNNNNNQSMMPLGNGICSWTGIDEVDDGEDIHDNQPDYDHNVMPTPFLPQRAYNGRLSGVSSPDDIAETETKYNDDPYHQIQVPCNPQIISNDNEEILCNSENYRWQLDISNQPQTNAPNTSDCNMGNNGDCFYSEQQCHQQYQQECQQQIHQEQINCNQMKNNFDCSFFDCNYNNNYNNNNNNNVSRGTSVAMSSDASTECSVNSHGIYRGNQQQQQQQQQRSCQSSQFCQYQESNSYQQPQLYQQISNCTSSSSSGHSSPGTDFETSQISLASYNSSHCMNNNNNNNNAFVDSPCQDNDQVLPSLIKPSFMKPSFIKPLCVDCGEQECRCNDNSNNQRRFQATNNFLNPNSYRIHQEINHKNNRNNRNQRRSQHIEQMRYNLNNLYNNNNMNNINWM